VNIKRELQILQFKKNYAQLMVDEGLKANYEEQMQQFKAKLRQTMEQIAEAEKIIEITEKQLHEGVEIKEEEKNGYSKTEN